MEETVARCNDIGHIEGCHPILPCKEAHHDKDRVTDNPKDPMVRDRIGKPEHADNA